MNTILDDKAKFQKIQAKLERYLYEYKNCFPKNVWQILGIDIPFVTLFVSSFVVLKLMGFCLVSIILLILIILPTLLIWSSDSSSIWTKLIKQRKTYKDDSQIIINKINAVKTKDFEKYPDVKKYLENFRNELSTETLRKQNIEKRYKKIMIIGLGVIVAGMAFTFTIKTKLSYFQDSTEIFSINRKEEIRNEFMSNEGYAKYLNLKETEPVAQIAPLTKISDYQIQDTEIDEQKTDISIYFREDLMPVFTMRMPVMINPTSSGKYIYRLMITDKMGRPVNGIPYFDFADNTSPATIISSYTIAFKIENNPYEIIRRVKYLQDNAANLRYTVDLIKYNEDVMIEEDVMIDE